MCRSVVEGGRRCPHDGSDARQARRINAAMRDGFASSTVQRSEEASVVSERLTIKEAVASVDKTKATLREVMSAGYVFDGVVDGVEYPSKTHARTVLMERLESEIRTLGAAYVEEVESRTGIKFEDITAYHQSIKEGLLAETEQLIKEDEKLKADIVEQMNLEGQNTYFITDKVRLAHRDDPDNPVVTALYERIIDMDKRREDLRSRASKFEHSLDEKTINDYNTNREKLIKVLSENRSLGGDLKIDASSDKAKGKIVQSMVQVLPTDWIEASNADSTDLKIKKTTARAHYNRYAVQNKSAVIELASYTCKPKDWEPSGTHHESGWVKVEPVDEDGFVRVEYGGRTFEDYVGDNENFWIVPSWEYVNSWAAPSDGSKPRGNGWVQVEILDKTYNHVTQETTYTPKTTWRRPFKKRQLVSSETKAELLVDGAKDPFYEGVAGASTALHEFAHRVEDSQVAFMSGLQDTFYRRRTEVDGVPMETVRLYRGKKEFAIPDNFTADYMGKRYPDGKHFEVLSTGLEAVFSGEFGGLIGLKGKKPDYDMRDFIVGMLAGV